MSPGDLPAAVAGSSLRKTGALLRAGSIGPVAAVESALGRIEQVEGEIRAFLHIDPEGARERARKLEALSPGKRGALHGMPISVKDNIAIRGMPLTCASAILDGFVSPFDATVTARLEDAGAVLLGKTNLDEFAMGSSTSSGYRGATRNPWDPGRVPGGSSGGAAASVAAGMATVGIGTDTGGSLRHPGAHCGLYAIRPTWGRVSRYGVTAYASSLDQVGAVAWNLADLAAVLSVIAGPDPRDATSSPTPVPDLSAAAANPVLPERIAIPAPANRPSLDPDGEEAYEQCVFRLRSAGVRVEEVDLPDWRLAIAAYYVLACAEASSNLARFDGVRYGRRQADGVEGSRSAGFGREVRERILIGTACLSSGYEDEVYRAARRHRDAIRNDLLKTLEGTDAILLPVAVSPPRRHADRPAAGQEYEEDRCNIFASLAGLPALALPADTWRGLPFGVQIVGAPWREDRLIRFAAAFGEAGIGDREQAHPTPAARVASDLPGR